jgi:thioredoxin:protein disulfide reductase
MHRPNGINMLKNKDFSLLARQIIGLFIGIAWTGLALCAEPTFLKAEEAYRTEAQANARDIAVTYRVHDGYYLYRNRFAFSTETPGISLDAAEFPPGLPHRDEYFGEQEIYRGTFTVHVPYHRTGESPENVELKLRLQGCADAGLCYPPQTRSVTVELPAAPPVAQPALPARTSQATALLDKLVKPEKGAPSAAQFLPAEQAFRASAQTRGTRVVVRVDIAEGYYLYRDRFHLTVTAPTTLAAPLWPAGETHHDEYFGDQVVFRGALQFEVPFSGTRPQQVTLTYQGCADAGLCYTPQTVRLAVSEAQAEAATAPALASAGAEQDRLAQLVRSGHWWAVVGAFWLFGLLLAFTPCVLPMVPILAGIIAGDGASTRPGRSFALALAYVAGMAFTYTTVGVAFAAAGAQAQAVFQQPWILILFAALFVALAMAMFGAFELALPSGLQTRFADLSGRIKGGRLLSSAVMGALSSLIVTACVAPPLVATFIVIGQAGAVGRGALALGSLSLGMGTPLLLVGASAGRLLPKSGPWMETVKALFGVVFLGVAVWMLDRLVHPRITQLAWGIVAISAVWVLTRVGLRGGTLSIGRRLAALVLSLYAAALIGSASLGGSDPIRPWVGTPWGPAVPHGLVFRSIKSIDDLQRVLAEAKAAAKPVMLDFSADWCVSCKEMDSRTFNVPSVQTALARYIVVRADVTANDEQDQALLRSFGIYGPPTTAFFKADGEAAERREFRLVGFVDADQFLQHLAKFEASP